MSLIPNAVLESAPRKPLALAAVVLASGLRLLRQAIEARAGVVAGVRPKP